LLAERFDVALRVGPLIDSSLVRVKVGTAQPIVVAAPSYLARAGTPETPRDLGRHNCIRFSNVTAAQEWRFRGKKGDVSVPIVGGVEINHGGAMRNAVIAGIGIARLPEFLVADELESGALVPLLEDFATAPTGIHLVHVAGGKPLPKVTTFLEEIGNGLRQRLRPRVRA
jgi:DNA-binding transcriptional LysR family regulator